MCSVCGCYKVAAPCVAIRCVAILRVVLSWVLAKQYPEVVSELMAYMVVIIKASQRFIGLAWANYALYHCQAATKKCIEWPQTNGSLFNLCFTGNVRTVSSAASVESQVML